MSGLRLLQLTARSAAWVLAAAWALKAVSVARGLRRVPDLNEPEFNRSPAGMPRVTVIVPACNEEAGVAGCVASLVAQDYPAVRVVAVDDRSVDRTGKILDALAAVYAPRLSVLHVTELPAGWLGKTHAMAFGARHAMATDAPEWLLFTDADVVFAPDAIRRALVFAAETEADHAVLLPTTLVHTAGEAMVMGCLHVLGMWAVRAWRVADPTARDAVGVGAFGLLRVSAYATLGGYEAIRLAVVEDLTMGRRVKAIGLRQRVAFGPGLVSLHWAAGVHGVLRTMQKNLFAVFEYRLALLGLGCVGLLVMCVGPFVALAVPGCRVPGAIAVLGVGAMYRQSESRSRIPAWYGAGLPVAATLLVCAMAQSALTTLRDGGVTWRGTFYPLRELRAQGRAELLTPLLPL